MKKNITYSLADNLIPKIASLIEKEFIEKGKDLSRLAIVFGGKRPSLFLKRELSKKIKKSFFPPAFFSIDEFVEYALSKKASIRRISELDACYIIYALAKKIAPEILKGNKNFSRFLPWAREVLKFIELLDLEDVEAKALENIKMNAAIGYDVPESINLLLKNILSLRDAYHNVLKERGVYSRGLMYLSVSRITKEIDLNEFDRILFCNFFSLHKTEDNIIKHFYNIGKASLISQPLEPSIPEYKLSIYAGSDMHQEACLVREILKKIKNPESTVIVLPDPDTLVPLLSEIACFVKGFNVSMGYPLRRSSLYNLFESIFRAQATKKAKGTKTANMYYTKDYLRVLSHPFVKNLKAMGDPPTIATENLFIRLKDIEDLKEVHNLLFGLWEKIKTFKDFSRALEIFLDALVDKSPLSEYPQDGFAYPINLKIIEKLFRLKEDFSNAIFADEVFSNEDIFRFFQQEMEHQVISFLGSPLKGLQILGLFETRSLSFENVIILDANESVFPRLKIYEPLIPGEVMVNLGLNRLKEEEEIQRYQFRRLISSAKNVFLVYNTSEDKERSRFIEELIWEKEKQAGSLGVVPVRGGSFQINVLPEKTRIYKSRAILDSLKGRRFSPTSINTYLHCPQSFYYHYVLGLKEKEDFLEEPEGLHVGKFIHELLEETFKRFVGKSPRIDKKFRDYFLKTFSDRFDDFFARRMKRDSFLLREVMEYRLKKFLDREQERDVKEIVCLERKFETSNLISYIDRIDRLKDGSLFIIDYKTGGNLLVPKDIKKMEAMELTRESIKDTIRSFQLPLYLYLVRKTYKNDCVRSGLYSLKDLEIVSFPKEKESDRRSHPFRDTLEHALDICIKALEFIIAEILNPEIDFAASEDPRYCKNCPFFYMCR